MRSRYALYPEICSVAGHEQTFGLCQAADIDGGMLYVSSTYEEEYVRCQQQV